MQRSLLLTILSAVSIPVASLWAAPPIATPSSQFASQIVYEANRVQADADGLQGYVRSGADSRLSLNAYAQDMSQSLQKLGSLVDKATAQPGVSGEARAQAEKMKMQVAGLRAMVAGTVPELNPSRVAGNAEAIFADTNNIIHRSNSLCASAQSFSSSN